MFHNPVFYIITKQHNKYIEKEQHINTGRKYKKYQEV